MTEDGRAAEMKVQLHNLQDGVTVLGPGVRYGLWVQGCPRRCPGCMTPQSQPREGGWWAETSQVAEDILALCREPVQFETILQNLFTGYGLELTLEQYVLVGSTVRSYLAWLVDGGQVTYGFDQNRLLWERA